MDPDSFPDIPFLDSGSSTSHDASTAAAAAAATNTAGPSTGNNNLHGAAAATGGRRIRSARTWTHISAAVLESLRDLHYVLSLAGVVEHVSPNSTALLGYSPEQLVGTVLADHVHEDDAPVYRDELREASSTGRPFRFYSRIRSCMNNAGTDDAETQSTISVQHGGPPGPSLPPSYSIFEIIGRFHQNAPPEPVPIGIGLVATPPHDDGIFVLMARPYPLAQGTKLDSFLALKIENARLTAQLAALKAEQEDGPDGDEHDLDYAEHQRQQKRPMAAPAFSASSFRRPSDGFPWFDVTPATMSLTTGSGSSAQESAFGSGSSSVFGPASSNSTSSSTSIPPSISSINRSSTSFMLSTTRMLPSTGGTGVVSKSPTNTPTVMEGDVGIPFIVKALTGAAGIKKRAKHVEDYVCAWCSTTSSPEWRKGPGGPKSLCNACGLRYAKSRRKSGSAPGGSGGSDGGNNNSGPATGPDADGGGSAAGGASATTVGPVVA